MTALKDWFDSSAAERIGKVMAAVALLLSLVVGGLQYRLTRCQAAYAEASNTSQRARAEAAELDRQAQDRMFDAIADRPRDSIAEIRAYRDTRRAANEQRERNPIPPAPSTNCG